MVAYRSPEVAIFVATADGDRFAEVRFKKFAAADPIDEEIIDPRSGEPTGDTKADLWQRDGPNEIFEKILRLREGDNSVRFRPTDIEPWRRYGPQRLTSGRDLPGTCRKHGDRGNCAEQLREAIEQTGRVIIPV